MSGCFHARSKWTGVYTRIGNLVGRLQEWPTSKLFTESKPPPSRDDCVSVRMLVVGRGQKWRCLRQEDWWGTMKHSKAKVLCFQLATFVITPLWQLHCAKPHWALSAQIQVKENDTVFLWMSIAIWTKTSTHVSSQSVLIPSGELTCLSEYKVWWTWEAHLAILILIPWPLLGNTIFYCIKPKVAPSDIPKYLPLSSLLHVMLTTPSYHSC